VGDHDDSYFGEFLEDHRDDDPLLETNREALKAQIDTAMETLNYREREILRLRYGLADGYTYTLEEVGRIFKVTRERVRQVEAKAIRKLQHPVRSRKLRIPRSFARFCTSLRNRQWNSQSDFASAKGSTARVVTCAKGASGVAQVMSFFSYQPAAGKT